MITKWTSTLKVTMIGAINPLNSSILSEETICPMKDIKIIFCPGSRLLFSFGTLRLSTCLEGLLSNVFLLLYLVLCHIGGFIRKLLWGEAVAGWKGYFVRLAGINLCHLSSLIYTLLPISQWMASPFDWYFWDSAPCSTFVRTTGWHWRLVFWTSGKLKKNKKHGKELNFPQNKNKKDKIIALSSLHPYTMKGIHLWVHYSRCSLAWRLWLGAINLPIWAQLKPKHRYSQTLNMV